MTVRLAVRVKPGASRTRVGGGASGRDKVVAVSEAPPDLGARLAALRGGGGR